MARRRGGLMALRAALGAVGGGLEGYGKLQESQREQAERAKQAERQAMLDRIGLTERGWVTPEQQAGTMRQAAPGLQSLAGAASSMMRGGAPSPVDMESLQRGAGQFGPPAGRVTMGGQEFMLPETPAARAMREVELTAGRERRVRQEQSQERQAEKQRERAAVEAERAAQAASLRGVGRSAAEAEVAARFGAGYSDLMETPSVAATRRGQDISAATARRGQDLTAARAAAASASAAAPSAPPGEVALPSISAAADRLAQLTPDDIRRMSAGGVAIVNTVQQQGGYTGVGVDWLGSKTGKVSELEREYVELTGAIADAVARKSERVGVLTNQDINRYRNQIIFKSGDSEQDKERKVARAVGWARWLNSQYGAPSTDGQSPQARFDQRVQRGMDSTGAASLVDRETQAAQVGRLESPTTPSPRMTADEWMDANPQRPGETDSDYLQRARAAIAAGGR